MWLSSLRRIVAGKSRSRTDRRRQARSRKAVRLMLESLEERLTPSGPQTAASYADLVNALAADTGTNTNYVIDITSGFQFDAGGQVTISQLGTGSTLTVEGQNGTNYALTGNGNRLFSISAGQNVTFKDLTLTGGAVIGATAQGGAIYDAGSNLTLTNVNLEGNLAIATGHTANGAGNDAQGGGLYISGGTVHLTNSNILANGISAAAGAAGAGAGAAGAAGGKAQGGGIYANGAILTVSGGSVSGNTLYVGNGGSGKAGTANHITGGAGGAGGLGQGGGIFAQGGSLTLTNAVSISGSTIESNVGGKGGAGDNGPGGAGGAGGNAGGGGVFASNAKVLVEGGATINDNTVFGGFGGNGGTGAVGKAGGQGGAAGLAAGGGLYVAGGSVNISGDAAINANTLTAGWGGYGGKGGIGGLGGVGGTAEGGGLYASDTPVTFLSGAPNFTNINSPGISANTADAGRGGNGGGNTPSAPATVGVGGNGGAGGQAQGGGIFITANNLAVTFGNATQAAAALGNTVAAGVGGSGGAGTSSNGVGGNGGLATGGGVTIVGNTTTKSSNTINLNNTTITGNTANGGSGGVGVTSAKGGVISNYGNGGDIYGGGLYVANIGSATILNSTMEGNLANAGGGAAGGGAVGTAKYGRGGNSLGGGLYANNSTLNVINSTFSTNVLAAATQVGTSKSVGGHSTGGGTAQGGGLYSSGGTLSLTNDTVAWNYLVSYTNRGAILGQGAGVYSATGNTLNLANTIDAINLIFTDSTKGENNSYATYNADLAGTLTLNDANLIGGVGGIDDHNLLPAIGTAPAGSQQLFAVPVTTNTLGGTTTFSGQVAGNYGGLTYTLPLAWNTSPAIDTGDPNASGIVGVTADQRGFAREIDGTIDIGATETQVILMGSAAPPTVQPNGTITYTLEVCNCEATAANVTLTDALDANTTYQSGSGTGWTVTAVPSSTNNNTLTATATVAAHTMATLTITVTVSATVANGTTLANTASITPTAIDPPTRSTTMDTPVGSGVATTSTSLTSSVSSSDFGQPVTFTATVSASSGTPTGTVTFEDGSTVLGTGSLSGGGATFTTSTLAVGGHSITAVYGGTSSDSGSTSNAVSLTVNQDATTTSLKSSASISVYGQKVIFTATVSANSPGSGTPTGTVTFEDGSTILGTGTLSNGIATFSTSNLSVATHSITAVYGGDTNYLGSSSAVSQTVNKDNTTTVLTSSVNPSVFGQSVTFTATVSVNGPGAGTPTGTVQFYDGSTLLGSGTLSGTSTDTATFSTSALSVASHTITAVYSGDSNDLGGKSSAVSQTVNKDSTTTVLTSSVNPSFLNQNVTFTATVSVVSPGVGTPTGTVTFEEGSTILGTGTLSGGVATFSTSTLPVNSNTITAVYGGDANDLGSSGTLAQQVDYKFGGFLPPLSNGISFALNRTIPIKFTLSDYNGNAITSLSAVASVQIQQVDASGNPINPPFSPASTNNQGLQYSGGQYQFNWQTKGLAAGYYEIMVTLADGTTQTKTVQLIPGGNSAGLMSGGSSGIATPGALMGGEVDLYVDNSDGELTSDELARIRDAITSINTLITPYGVTIVSVSNSTLANVTLSMNTTSSLGGYAQGILGCTTNADLVTLIQGWNWYAGSDATQIGSGQYDFETATVHELGHVLGLGHSSNSSSVMYPSLATGTTNRALAAADLNVPDSGSGPCALYAAPLSTRLLTSDGMGLTAPSSTSVGNNGGPLSGLDQVFANLALYLTEVRNAYQSQLSSLTALWQQADALAVQRLDALMSLEAGAMGLSLDSLMKHGG